MDVPAKEAAHTYETLLAQGHYFIDGAEELLETLYGQYRMYLVTNGTLSVQKGRLKSSGISRYFESIFISEELGYNKPGREYFNCCFSRIPDFHKETSVIVGDSLTSDIQGASMPESARSGLIPAMRRLQKSSLIMNLTVL